MFNHGYAKALTDDMDKIDKGETGVITAYFPYGDDDPIAAVWFGEGRWFTFKGWTEKQFLGNFEVIKEGENV